MLFTAKSFREAATRSGLEIESMKYTQGPPQWTASLMELLHDKGWVKMSAERPITEHPLSSVLIVLTAAFDFLRLPFARTAQRFVSLRKDARAGNGSEPRVPRAGPRTQG